MSKKNFGVIISIINKIILGAIGGGVTLGIISALIFQESPGIIIAAIMGAITGAVIWPVGSGIYRVVGATLSGIIVVIIGALIGAFLGVYVAVNFTGMLIGGLFGAFLPASFWILIHSIVSKTITKHNKVPLE